MAESISFSAVNATEEITFAATIDSEEIVFRYTDAARGPAGDGGGGGSVTSYVDDIESLPDYPTSFPTTPADISNVGTSKLLGRHGAGTGTAQEIGIDGGLELHGGNLRRAAVTGPVTIDAGDSVSAIADGALSIAMTNGLQSALNEKQATLTNYATISALTGYPETFTPSAHTHEIADITDWPDALTRDVIGYAIVGPTGEGNISTIEDTDSIYGARLDSAFVSSISNLLTWIKEKASAVFSAGDLMKWAATAADTRTNLGAQATLVSGTNIKTVASQSLLGSTNIPALLTDPTGITGAAALSNIVSLTQAQYDAIGSKSATTLYIIT